MLLILGVGIGAFSGYGLAMALDPRGVENESLRKELAERPPAAPNETVAERSINPDGESSLMSPPSEIKTVGQLIAMSNDRQTGGRTMAPIAWRILEGRILGMQGGNYPKFPYLPGEIGLGASTKDLRESLEEKWNLLSVDGMHSNGAQGEAVTFDLGRNISIVACGAWNNVHTIVVIGSWRRREFDGTEIDHFSTICADVCKFANGDEDRIGKLSSSWFGVVIRNGVKSGDAESLIKDDVSYSLHVSPDEKDPTYGPITCWFTIKSNYGPIGARDAVGAEE